MIPSCTDVRVQMSRKGTPRAHSYTTSMSPNLSTDRAYSLGMMSNPQVICTAPSEMAISVAAVRAPSSRFVSVGSSVVLA